MDSTLENYARAVLAVKSTQTDEELYNAVTSRTGKNIKLRRRTLLLPVAAVIACVIGVAGAAAFGSGVLSNLLRNQQAAEMVSSNVYEDSDGHVKMTVEEYLTDIQTAYAVVNYEALSQRGREWLDEVTADCYSFYLDRCMTTENGGKLAGGTIHGAVLMPEYNTESSRKYYLKFSLCTDDYTNGNGSVQLSYPMTGEVKTALFSAAPNVESRYYRLVGEGSPSEYFTPTYIRLSQLGYTIIGRTTVPWIDDGVALLTTEELHAAKKAASDCRLVMDDGVEIKLCGGMTTTLRKTKDEIVDNSDLNISIGSRVKNVNGEICEFAEVVDISKVSGVKIGGTLYSIR